MKCLPTNSRRGTSDIDLRPASPKHVPTGPKTPLGVTIRPFRALSGGDYARLVTCFADTAVQLHLNGPAMALGKGQMGNVG